MASSPVMTCASAASTSARSKRSNPNQHGSRSPSGTTANIRCPTDAKAVIISPTLVTARAIQLTPPYRGGPTLQDRAVIPQQRTAVPVEWDDVRLQLQRLANTLQPTQPDGASTLGSLVHTTADNLRGQGAAIRDSIVKLSQAMSALGDHSGDIFGSVKNLSASGVGPAGQHRPTAKTQRQSGLGDGAVCQRPR